MSGSLVAYGYGSESESEYESASDNCLSPDSNEEVELMSSGDGPGSNCSSPDLNMQFSSDNSDDEAEKPKSQHVVVAPKKKKSAEASGAKGKQKTTNQKETFAEKNKDLLPAKALASLPPGGFSSLKLFNLWVRHLATMQSKMVRVLGAVWEP